MKDLLITNIKIQGILRKKTRHFFSTLLKGEVGYLVVEI
jgi:hypothetical protein